MEIENAARRIFLSAAWIELAADWRDEILAVDGPEPWQIAIDIATRVHQGPLLAHRVQTDFAAAPISPAARQTLQAEKLFHAFRWQQIHECLEDVVSALRPKGIELLLLKGLAGLGDVYPQESLRPMRDLDLLVREAQLPEASATLQDAGFRWAQDAERYAGHHHLPPLFHPDSGICVELHRRPLSSSADVEGVPPLETLWERTRASALDMGESVRVLEPELQLAITALHFTHGEHIGWRIGQLIDVSRLCERYRSSMAWEALLTLPGPELALSLAVTLGYLRLRQLPSAPDEVIEALRRRARLRRWEERMLHALLDRYRIGVPEPWRLVSMRIGNILWDASAQRGSLATRSLSALNRVLSRGKKDWEATHPVVNGDAVETSASVSVR